MAKRKYKTKLVSTSVGSTFLSAKYLWQSWITIWYSQEKKRIPMVFNCGSQDLIFLPQCVVFDTVSSSGVSVFKGKGPKVASVVTSVSLSFMFSMKEIFSSKGVTVKEVVWTPFFFFPFSFSFPSSCPLCCTPWQCGAPPEQRAPSGKGSARCRSSLYQKWGVSSPSC